MLEKIDHIFSWSFPYTLEINDGQRTICAQDFAALTARWVRFFKENTQYHRGVVVNFEHWTMDVLACYMGLILSGTAYYALNTATMTRDDLQAVYDQGVHELVYFSRPGSYYPQDHLANG